MSATISKAYETCAETAKRLRLSLKHNFPGVTFSVRSKTYTGGASIRVAWTNGPTTEQVNSVSCRFEGADFDPMIDLKTGKTQISVDPWGNVKEVRTGSDYIFCDRDVTSGLEQACINLWRSRWNVADWNSQPDYEHQRMVRQGYSQISIPAGEAVEVTAQRAWDAFMGNGAVP